MKFYAILVFIYCSFSLSAQTYSTFAEVYDFQVGDEFHYEISPNTRYRIELITDIYTDSLFLHIDKQVTKIYNGTASTQNQTISVHKTQFAQSIFSYPSNTVMSMSTMDSSKYNNRRLNVINYQWWEYGYYYMTKEYVEGCGQISLSALTPSDTYSEQMVYYKKGTETWGQPIITGVKNIPPQLADYPAITPNPVIDKTFVNVNLLKSTKISIRLYDINGRLLTSPITGTPFPAGKHRLSLNMSDLTSGAYLCEVQLDGKSMSLKVLK